MQVENMVEEENMVIYDLQIRKSHAKKVDEQEPRNQDAKNR